MKNGCLLIDHRKVSVYENLLWKFHTAEKSGDNPLFTGNSDLDNYGCSTYGSVIQDQGSFRMWYQTWPWAPPVKGENFLDSMYVGYAESDDGYEWKRPDLGIVDFNGSKRNNLTNLFRHQPNVVPSPFGDGKFYGFGYANPFAKEVFGFNGSGRGFYAADSKDGLFWEEHGEDPVIPEIGDVCCVAWSERDKKFIGTPKLRTQYPMAENRAVGISWSDDFHNWTEPVLRFIPDELDKINASREGFVKSDFYGLSVYPVHDMFIGFLWVFKHLPPLSSNGGQGGIYGHTEVQLVYSFDGELWYRSPGRFPFIKNGDRGDFDFGTISMVNTPFEYKDELWIYYSANRVGHGFYLNPDWNYNRDVLWDEGPNQIESIGLAKLKKDRFASLSSDSVEGSATLTVGIKGNDRLMINGRTGRINGWIKAELFNPETGTALPGRTFSDSVPFTGDAVSHRMVWRNPLPETQSDKDYNIRFRLFNADLYAVYTAEKGEAES